MSLQIQVEVYSKVYMDEEDTSWSARPTRNLLRRLHSGEDSKRWIALIEESRISIGDPVNTFTNSDALFVPSWFLQTVGLEDGAKIKITFHKCEDLPKASRLSFQVLGDIPGDIDIRDLLEEPLSQLGVLEVGQMIPVPLLDDVTLFLQECEPESVVFLDGADIALEIEYEKKDAEALQPGIFRGHDVEEDDFMPSLPTLSGVNTSFQGIGRRLGGNLFRNS